MADPNHPNPALRVCGEHEALGLIACDCDPDTMSGACWGTKRVPEYRHSACKMGYCACRCHKTGDLTWSDPTPQADVDAAIASIEMAVRARVTRREPKNTRYAWRDA